MMSFALSFAAAQLVALFVHAVTWWLRRRALWLLALPGFAAMLLISAATVLLMLIASGGRDYDGYPVSEAERAAHVAADTQALRWMIAGVIAALVVIPALGYAHSLWLAQERRWRVTLWMSATLALFAEGALACWLGAMAFQEPLSKALRGRGLQEVSVELYGAALGVTLLVLALFRPWLLKLWRVVVRSARPYNGARSH